MGSRTVPTAAGGLLIAPDGEAAGRGAAGKLADRATSLGWNVSLLDPGDGLDWNDVLLSGVAA